jgi:hypothetical protein
MLIQEDSVNVYVGLGAKSHRLKRLSQAEVENKVFADKVECTFPAPKQRKSTKKKTSSADQDPSGSEGEDAKPATKKSKAKSQPKPKKLIDEEKDLASASDDDFDAGDYGQEEEILKDTDYGIQGSSDTEEGTWEIMKPPKAAKSIKGTTGGRERKTAL